jgi:predicted glycoside hydrolase/deacetylase ChbG (UPF0249 family)
MANAPAFDDAVALALANPTLGVGCHITLIDGTPVAHPQSIPSLLGGDGKSLRSTPFDFLQALLRGEIREDDIEREAVAQVQKLQRAGIDVTHLDTHKHTHIFPTVARPLLHLAERTRIGAVRNPFEPPWASALGHGGLLRRLQLKLLHRNHAPFQNIPQIHHAHVLTTDGTIGISATGTLTSNTLAALMNALPAEGTFELCCHPGYNDTALAATSTRLRENRNTEREALLQIIPSRMSQPNAPELIHYGNLGSLGAMRELGSFHPNTGYERVI